jgi:hypothetical protein
MCSGITGGQRCNSDTAMKRETGKRALWCNKVQLNAGDEKVSGMPEGAGYPYIKLHSCLLTTGF